MAKKTNCVINGIPYFRKYARINGKRQMFYGESEKDWNRKVDKAKELAAKGIIDTKSTLGAALRTWIYYILPTESKKRNKVSYAVYEGIYRNQICINKAEQLKARRKIKLIDKIDELVKMSDELLGVHLIDTKSDHIKKFLTTACELGYTLSMLESSKKVLNLFFEYVEGEGYIGKNPCKNAEIPDPNITEGGSVVLTDEDGELIEVFSDEDMRKIKSVLSDKRNRFLIVLGFATAMREGEMWALKHEDFKTLPLWIHQSQKTIRHIKEGLPIEYETIDGAPKSKAGYRYMPIADWVMKEYEIHKKLCQAEKLTWGKGRLSDNDHVFLSPTGKRCQSAQLQKVWKEILLEAGVEYKKFHTLRHTCITKWVQAPGANIIAVKELAGHKKLETTLKYTHIELGNKVELINSVTNEIFG